MQYFLQKASTSLAATVTMATAGYAGPEQRALELFLGRCDSDVMPLLSRHVTTGLEHTAALQHVDSLQPHRWQPTRPFAQDILETGEPTWLQWTVVNEWAARNWTWGRVEELFIAEHGNNSIGVVMQSDDHLYVVPDVNAPMAPLLRYHVPHQWFNVSATQLLHAVRLSQEEHDQDVINATQAAVAQRNKGQGRHLVYFSPIPDSFAVELEPHAFIFLAPSDAERRSQFLWISTPGSRTHTHFDSDHNFFVQVLGRKRFTLWAPNQTSLLCPFPRLHPLWHKSRALFDAPDVTLLPCTNYSKSKAMEVELGAGDLLYVPPFWWHTVETLSPSLSLSSLSRNRIMYEEMQAVHTVQHLFDNLNWYQSRIYILRAFLTSLVLRMSGAENGYEQTFFAKLLLRYSGLDHVFYARSDDDVSFCTLDERGTPLCQDCVAEIKFDVNLIWQHFEALPADFRDTLFVDYVEQLTASVVGVDRAWAFWKNCFSGQRFFLTEAGSEEDVMLWEAADSS